jgi:hypothetical protein
MRPQYLLLSMAAFALAACSDAATSPKAVVPSASQPAAESVAGILEVAGDDPLQYGIRRDDGGLVLLICDVASLDATMVGDRVLATGRFAMDGEFIVENVQRIIKIPNDEGVVAGKRKPF